MSFHVDLFMSCPCHDSYVPFECQRPCYWYHNCSSNYSKIHQKIDQNLTLYCNACSHTDHVKKYLYFCNKTCQYEPYKNNCPQTCIIVAQQLANKSLTMDQRRCITALLNNLMGVS